MEIIHNRGADAQIAEMTASLSAMTAERDTLSASLSASNASLDAMTSERDLIASERDELLTRAMSNEFFAGMRRIELDGREMPNGMSIADETILAAKTSASRFLYGQTYRWPMSQSVPEVIMNRRFVYNIQPDMTGAAALPDIPAGATAVDYIYIYQRISAANSLGGAGVIDVPITWRNATGAFRIVLERTELTSPQQVTIVQGIEREILAGLGSAYTSTSTTARFIDLASGSSGANAGLDQAALVVLGWTIINATQMFKMISSDGGTPRRWRILHN